MANLRLNGGFKKLNYFLSFGFGSTVKVCPILLQMIFVSAGLQRAGFKINVPISSAFIIPLAGFFTLSILLFTSAFIFDEYSKAKSVFTRVQFSRTRPSM